MKYKVLVARLIHSKEIQRWVFISLNCLFFIVNCHFCDWCTQNFLYFIFFSLESGIYYKGNCTSFMALASRTCQWTRMKLPSGWSGLVLYSTTLNLTCFFTCFTASLLPNEIVSGHSYYSFFLLLKLKFPFF